MRTQKKLAGLERPENEQTEMPVYGRVRDIERTFGIKRASCYALLKEGKIRGCAIRVRGRQRSRIRLIEFDSVRAYLASEMEAQQQEVRCE